MSREEILRALLEFVDVRIEAKSYIINGNDYFIVSKGGWKIEFDLSKQKGGES